MQNSSEERVGIVVPCYNEAGSLSELVRVLNDISESSKIDFLLVNNGSTDSTSQDLQKFHFGDHVKFFEIPVNKGYGYGIKKGLEQLKNPIIGWMHADLQTSPKAIQDIKTSELSELCFIKGCRVGRTLIERLFTGGMSLIMSTIFRTSMNDINGQPTIMSRELFESWQNAPDDFALDLYAYVWAKKQKARIIRNGVKFSPRIAGKSSWNRGFKSQIKFSLNLLASARVIKAELK